MDRKCLAVVAVILFFFVATLVGCPKKTVVMEEPSTRKAEETVLDKEKQARFEAEKALREKEAMLREEASKREAAERALEAERALREKERREREEAVRRALAERAKELEALREKAARLEAERALREKELREKEEAEKRALAEKEKEFERTLVAKRSPGIEGEVFESHMLKDIYFAFDRYDITPSSAEILRENASILMKYPHLKIQIEGHCDERGTQEYNLALGERRASSAKSYLVSLGVPEDRLSTISYGEEMPVDPGHNEEAWAKNRRCHFVVLSK